jgi:VIT1/CCC1 family predicted Fe2+/Mn2+ transporter
MTLAEHLAKEHYRTPFQTYLKEIVYGGNDGIVTTFAVVAGFAGAGGSESNILAMGTGAVLLFGFANLFADAASMGLGNFLSVRAEQDMYRKEQKKELFEIENETLREKSESVEILVTKGFSQDDANKLVEIYSKNKSYWLEFMMKYELELSNPLQDNPALTGLATAIAFITFGSIPLWPYVLIAQGPVFLYSIFATFSALFLLGVLRWRVTRHSALRSILEVLFIGGLSATIAFLVGTIFS